MPFAPVCFWAFQRRATFWAIFEKVPLVPLLPFFKKCGFWMTWLKIAITWPFGHFWSRCLRQNVFQYLHFKCVQLEDNAICASVLLGLSNKGYFSANFFKISFGPTFALLQKMRVLGNLAKIAITWPFGLCLKPLFAQKSLAVFAF